MSNGMNWTDADVRDARIRMRTPIPIAQGTSQTLILQLEGPPVRASKFNAVICEADGIKFRSKKERARYVELCTLKAAGLCWFLRQVAFHLPGNTKYVCDFIVFWKDGKVSVEDVKGRRLPAYIKNKKQVEALYPVRIEEV